MGKVTHIASVGHNSKLWSPEQCVEDCLKEIRAGTIKPTQLVISYLEVTEDGEHMRPGYFLAGVGYADHIALLEIAKAAAISAWQGQGE